MCADSTRAEPSDAATFMKLSGRIERHRLAAGTKSEHEGLVLRTPDGTLHRLRRRGGNPFRDPALEALEGKDVRLNGELRDGVFWVQWDGDNR